MSAQVLVTETPTGWHVTVRDGDFVSVLTDGRKVTVQVTPDEPEQPLQVALA